MPSSDKKIDPKSPHNISCPVNVFDSPWSMKLSRTLKPGCLYTQLTLSVDSNCFTIIRKGRALRRKAGKLPAFCWEYIHGMKLIKWIAISQNRLQMIKSEAKLCNSARIAKHRWFVHTNDLFRRLLLLEGRGLTWKKKLRRRNWQFRKSLLCHMTHCCLKGAEKASNGK